MKVYSNDVPHDCRYLTNGKHYEFTPDIYFFGGGNITDDEGDGIYILTEQSELACAYLNNISAWKFVDETN